MTPARELRAETTINATPGDVWAVLTDLDLLRQGSPELVKMLPLKRGGLREGQWYLGINRRKGVFWPTRNVVTTCIPRQTLAWDTTTSGARWIFELTAEESGTRIVQRRPIPRKVTRVGRIFARVALGGAEPHTIELEDGMAQTLALLKTAAERHPAGRDGSQPAN